MTVNKYILDTGAAAHSKTEWETTQWDSIIKEVSRLQVRIVKATQEGKWGRVKSLQHLLTHSRSAKLLAVRRVDENDGSNTPGVDQMIWSTSEDKMRAVYSLHQREYKPQPLRRIYIPKKNKNMRPLSIPTLNDRAMQALYLLALDPVAEVKADINSYGFRKERSAADAIEQCFNALGRQGSTNWVLEGDIKSCFDKISHSWLEANIPMEKTILQKWLKAGFMENGILNPTIEGTPQGGIASPLLANITLDGLEKKLHMLFRKNCRDMSKYKLNYIRYADDFIVTGISKEFLENQVKPVIEEFLIERGLEVSKEKTKITQVENGFDFLGFTVRRYHGTLIIKPSKDSIKKVSVKLRQIIEESAQVKPEVLIARLNPIIRGWSHYFRSVCSAEAFKRISWIIFWGIWRWARRRHPKKSKSWIKGKYFRRIQNSEWVFFSKWRTEDGTLEEATLVNMADTKIVRHVKIKAASNPYDPAWDTYFEERHKRYLRKAPSGQWKLRSLLSLQEGKCAHCKMGMSLHENWSLHFKVRKSLGGTHKPSNLELLHSECYNILHHCETVS